MNTQDGSIHPSREAAIAAGAEHSMDKHNSTDTSATAQRAVASGPLVRAHNFITGIGWTDLGTALALCSSGMLLAQHGHPFLGACNTGISVIVWWRAPRPNAADEQRPALKP